MDTQSVAARTSIHFHFFKTLDINILDARSPLSLHTKKQSTCTTSVFLLVFSPTSTLTFFRAFGENLVAFCVRKVDVRGKVDVQEPKSQLPYVNIDVPYVNKKTLCTT